MSSPSRVEIKLRMDPALAKGTYCNLAAVGSTPNEFYIDFFQILAGTADAEHRCRVIATAQFAKAFHASLGETIRRHEELFGAVAVNPETIYTATGGN